MKSKINVTLVILLVFSATVLAQQQKNGIKLSTLTPEKFISRFELNLVSLALGFLKFGETEGKTVEELGVFLGKFYAPSWSKNLTINGFVSGMNRNWQVLGSKTELLTISQNAITGRRTLPYTKEEFIKRYGDSADVNKYLTFFKTVTATIADEHGFSYAERIESEWIYFEVKKK